MVDGGLKSIWKISFSAKSHAKVYAPTAKTLYDSFLNVGVLKKSNMIENHIGSFCCFFFEYKLAGLAVFEGAAFAICDFYSIPSSTPEVVSNIS